MKHFRSEHAFEKYKPHESWHKRLWRRLRRKQTTITPSAPVTHYKSHPFRNPQRVPTSKIKVILLCAILCVWVGCIAYLPYFRINKVDYFGLENITKSEMEDFLNQNFLDKQSRLPLNNYFFIKAGTVSEKLYKTFPFEGVEVVKVFPNKLEITVTEKISSIIYDNGQKYFLLDSAGTVTKYLRDVAPNELKRKTIPAIASFDTMSDTNSSTALLNTTTTVEHTPNNEKINDEFGDYPIIYDRRNIPAEVRQTDILPPEYITAILAWHKYLNEQGRAAPKYFVIDDLNSGIIIDTALSWNILFQPKADLEAQLNTFKTILPNIKPKEYVDLRFGEKVYWK